MTSTAAATPGILSGRYIWITIGSCALVFLGAFESLAVTTVMPTVSAALDGERLYALAFAGPLATGVIGMVIAGSWADRRGPKLVLYAAVTTFVIGLLIAGLTTSMEVFVAGRFLQGLGSGAQTVALYVVVACVYPEDLHPKIFAGFATAWVVPSLVGPTAAGLIAEAFHWRWVFLGVVALVVLALALVMPALRNLNSPASEAAAPWAIRRILWAAVAAAAVLGLNLFNDLPHVGVPLAVAAIAIAICAVKQLVPQGTLLARRGLPSVVLNRGLGSAAFFGTQIYLPYFLTERHEFSPTMAGFALTGGALAWSAASLVQGRLATRLTHVRAVTSGNALVLTGIAFVLATVVGSLDPVLITVAWVVAGAGMGLMYPRLSSLTLSLSTPENQGVNTSALTVSDSFGSALALAIAGALFVSLSAGTQAYAGIFVMTMIIALCSLIVAPRVAARNEHSVKKSSLAHSIQPSFGADQ